jgi:hypothetical protein
MLGRNPADYNLTSQDDLSFPLIDVLYKFGVFFSNFMFLNFLLVEAQCIAVSVLNYFLCCPLKEVLPI